jgi:hypothetical protein
VIGIDLNLGIECRRIEPAARLPVKRSGMGWVVVYEIAEKQSRFSLVEHFCRKQVVHEGLK